MYQLIILLLWIILNIINGSGMVNKPNSIIITSHNHHVYNYVYKSIVDKYLGYTTKNMIQLPTINDTKQLCPLLTPIEAHALYNDIHFVIHIDYTINQSWSLSHDLCHDHHIAIQIEDDIIIDYMRIIRLIWHKYQSNTHERDESRRALLTPDYSSTEWTIATSILPRGEGSMATCYYQADNKIYLFGGWHHQKQFVIYDITHNSFEVEYSLPMDVYGENNQYYTRMDYIFYWLDVRSIIVYNLNNKNFENQIVRKQTHSTISCLTSGNNLLYIIGGIYDNYTYAKTVEIYNISSGIWLSQIPSIQTERAGHSCLIHPIQQQLWVIGGYHYAPKTIVLHLVETISLNDMKNQKWTYSQSLIYAVYKTVAVLYEHYIIVMGGYGKDQINCNSRNEIQIINCNTGNVFIAGYLKYVVGGASGILVGDRVYLFGGWNGSAYIQTWQYLDLTADYFLTNSPSQFPTSSPTDITINPSYPTKDPSEYPTNDPTISPSDYATNYPTISPTNDPIVYATDVESVADNLDKLPWIIVAICVGFIVLVIVLFALIRKYLKEKARKMISAIQLIQEENDMQPL
eukprot:411522_1